MLTRTPPSSIFDEEGIAEIPAGTTASPASSAAARVRKVVTRRPAAATGATPPPAPARRDSVAVASLARLIDAWGLDLQAVSASPRYITAQTETLNKFLWWCQREAVCTLSADSIRDFLIYVQTAHTFPEGRWGERGQTRADHEGKRGCPVSTRYKAVSDTRLRDNDLLAGARPGE